MAEFVVFKDEMNNTTHFCAAVSITHIAIDKSLRKLYVEFGKEGYFTITYADTEDMDQVETMVMEVLDTLSKK